MTVSVYREQEILQGGEPCLVLETNKSPSCVSLFILRSRYSGRREWGGETGVTLTKETAVDLVTKLLEWAMGQEAKS